MSWPWSADRTESSLAYVWSLYPDHDKTYCNCERGEWSSHVCGTGDNIRECGLGNGQVGLANLVPVDVITIIYGSVKGSYSATFAVPRE